MMILIYPDNEIICTKPWICVQTDYPPQDIKKAMRSGTRKVKKKNERPEK